MQLFTLQLNILSLQVDDLRESLPSGVAARFLALTPLPQSVSVCFICGFVDLSISD